MIFYSQKLFFFFFFVYALFLQSCGYVPLSTYTRESFGNPIFIDLEVNTRDPQNSVLIKDTILEAFSSRLGVTLTHNKEEASSIIKVSLLDSSFSSLAEEQRGFTSFYRCKVTLLFNYNIANNKHRTLKTVGYYNFALDESSILTDSKRLQAIHQASIQAIDMFISRASIEGF